MLNYRTALLAATMLGGLAIAGQAHATLSVFQTFTGNQGVSSDGCGSTTQACTVTASVPVGSTLEAAYLYSSLFSNTTTPGGTLNGSPVSYTTALGANGSLQAWRADVTSIVAPIVGGGAASPFTFNVTETNSFQDGEALVVVVLEPDPSDDDGRDSRWLLLLGRGYQSHHFREPAEPLGSGLRRGDADRRRVQL